MTRTTFENITISLTAPDATAAYDALCALLSTDAARDLQVSFCTDTYIRETAGGPTIDGRTADLFMARPALLVGADADRYGSDADLDAMAERAAIESAQLQRAHNADREPSPATR